MNTLNFLGVNCKVKFFDKLLTLYFYHRALTLIYSKFHGLFLLKKLTFNIYLLNVEVVIKITMYYF